MCRLAGRCLTDPSPGGGLAEEHTRLNGSCLPSFSRRSLEDNPLVWMLKVNGLLMDIRTAPREAQEVAFQKGLIPYIPADRQQRSE